jgi:Cytochrome c oxidase subunit IV
MKVETWLWSALTLFYIVLGMIYTLISDDPVGSSILLIASGFGGLIAGWTWDWGRRHGDRPEDRLDATTADAVGPVGVFPTQSLRPFTLAVGATAIMAGIPLGSWMSMGGLAIVMSQVFLLVRDLDTPQVGDGRG